MAAPLRDTEIPYVMTTRAVNIWLRGGDAKPVLNDVPDHLRELVKKSVLIQCKLITRWARRYQQGLAVPEKFLEQVKTYLEGRR